MSDYERLKSVLAAKPFLACDAATGSVQLVTQAQSLELMAQAGLFNSQVIMNAGRALENFVQLVGKPTRTFGLREIATMTGTPYSQAYNWVAQKVIIPSIRPASGSGTGKDCIFSWSDGFIAGICGAFRRQGVRLDMLRQVQSLFSDATGHETKQTARRGSSAERS